MKKHEKGRELTNGQSLNKFIIDLRQENNIYQYNRMKTTVLTNQAFPMKICYLKPEDKPKQPAKEEKPSLAYLSSVIQSQKNQTSENKSKTMKLFAQFGQESKLRWEKSSKKSIDLIEAFQQSKLVQQKSKSLEKPMLTSIVGENWQKLQKKKKKHFFKPKFKSYLDPKKNQQYQQELTEQFRDFVRKKHLKLPEIPIEDEKCSITKPDQRRQTLMNRKFNLRSVGRKYTSTGFKPNTSSKDTRDKVQMEGERYGKAGSSFDWSRLSQNNHFTIS